MGVTSTLVATCSMSLTVDRGTARACFGASLDGVVAAEITNGRVNGQSMPNASPQRVAHVTLRQVPCALFQKGSQGSRGLTLVTTHR